MRVGVEGIFEPGLLSRLGALPERFDLVQADQTPLDALWVDYRPGQNKAAEIALEQARGIPIVLSEPTAGWTTTPVSHYTDTEFLALADKYQATILPISTLLPVRSPQDLRCMLEYGLPAPPVALSTLLTEVLDHLLRPQIKCIVTDLDDVLWNGVVGDDPLEDIRITQSHKALHKYLKDLETRGYLLAISSRNTEETLSQIKHHPDLMIDLDKDFAARRLDFTAPSKTDHLKSIAEELNIELGSMLFIDDDRRNTDEVALITGIPVIHHRSCAATLLQLVSNPCLWKTSTTGSRTASYHAAAKRREQAGNMTHSDYLESLAMQIQIRCQELTDYDRAEELFARCNQFNFNGTKFLKTEFYDPRHHPDRILWTARLWDVYEDYGVVCAAVTNSTTLLNAVVSCRALGRGVEDFFFGYLREKVFVDLTASYKSTGRNHLIQPFLDRLAREESSTCHLTLI
jgi:FkbH-like protein